MIKPKLMSVVMGAIAFALTQPVAQAQKPLSLPGQLNVTPKQLASIAPIAPTNAQPSLIAQANPANPFSSLNLSAAQETQIRRIDALIQAQVKNALTPAQWSELQSLQASGASKGAALAKLNLSPQQITQLKEIESIAQQRLLSILNAEQKKQLQKGPVNAPAATAPTSASPPPMPSTPSASPAPSTPPAQASSPPSALAALNLTTEQQAQVQQVQALAQAQIQSILSPDQQKQLQTLQSANLSQAAALQQLNLTGTQKSQLQEVESLAQQRILSILTAEQKKKLLTP